jgi:hypothetical protein
MTFQLPISKLLQKEMYKKRIENSEKKLLNLFLHFFLNYYFFFLSQAKNTSFFVI